MPSATKDARLEARVTRRRKMLLGKAAANEVLEKERAIRPSQRDFERFLRALEEQPEKPTPTMREAVKAHNRGRVVGDRHGWSSSD